MTQSTDGHRRVLHVKTSRLHVDSVPRSFLHCPSEGLLILWSQIQSLHGQLALLCLLPSCGQCSSIVRMDSLTPSQVGSSSRCMPSRCGFIFSCALFSSAQGKRHCSINAEFQGLIHSAGHSKSLGTCLDVAIICFQFWCKLFFPWFNWSRAWLHHVSLKCTIVDMVIFIDLRFDFSIRKDKGTLLT